MRKKTLGLTSGFCNSNTNHLACWRLLKNRNSHINSLLGWLWGLNKIAYRTVPDTLKYPLMVSNSFSSYSSAYIFSSTKLGMIHKNKIWEKFNSCQKKVAVSLMLGGGSLVAKSCPALATPQTADCQDPLSVGFPRRAHWSGIFNV